MVTRPSYKLRWREKTLGNLGTEGWGGVGQQLANQGHFPYWARHATPWSEVERYLDYSVEISLGDPTNALVSVFAEHAELVADRMNSDVERWQDDGMHGWGKAGIAEENRLRAAIATQLVKAFRRNTDIDMPAVVEACRSFVAAAPGMKGAVDWSYQPQGRFLIALLWLLHAGCRPEALTALKLRKQFRVTQVMRDWVGALSAFWPADEQALPSPAFVEHVLAYYDQIRDPALRGLAVGSGPELGAQGRAFNGTGITQMRVLIALIKRRWIDRLPLGGHWPDLLADIAA